MEGQGIGGTDSGGGGDFFEDFRHECLAAEAGDDGHAEEEVDLGEEGFDLGQGGGGVEGEAGEAAGGADAAEGFGDVVIGLDVDGDEVRAGIDEALEVVVRARDHEVGVEEDVVDLIDGFDDGGAERDVVDEVSVHDVEVHPVCAGVDGADDFIGDFGEVGGEQGWGDDVVFEGRRVHGWRTNHGVGVMARKILRAICGWMD